MIDYCEDYEHDFMEELAESVYNEQADAYAGYIREQQEIAYTNGAVFDIAPYEIDYY